MLFSWIKKNPDPGGRALRGLLVIDEAKDFVPSSQASVCKESLMRLAAQARKYHLGLIFATQNPKDIENRIVGNCSTHFYGKVNAPAASGN
jgi:DNA helicase HerA-like ATPase